MLNPVSQPILRCGGVQDTWGRIQWLWDQPILKQVRITLSMAQWTVRLPALLALVATQMGFLASQVRLRLNLWCCPSFHA